MNSKSEAGDHSTSGPAPSSPLERDAEVFERILESLDAIVWEADADSLRFTFVGEAAEPLLGFPISQWLEDPNFWLSRLHPSDSQWVVRQRKQSIAERYIHEMEYRLVGSENETVWVRDAARFVDRGDGASLVGVMVDVTRQKITGDREQSYSELLSVIDDLHRQLLANPKSPGSIANAAVLKLSRVLPIDRASILEFGPESEFAIFLASWQNESFDNYPLKNVPVDMLSAVLESAVVETYHRDLRKLDRPSELTETLLRMGIQSTLSVPLRLNDRVVGMLNLGSVKTDGFADDDIRVARIVGDIVALGLQRARLEQQGRGVSKKAALSVDDTQEGNVAARKRTQTRQALSDSEDLLSSISRNISEGIFRSTPAGRLVYVNNAFANQFGYDSVQEVLDLESVNLYANANERERLKDLVRLNGFIAGEEVEFVRKDGSTFWGMVSSTAVLGEEGNIEFYDGAVADITRIKHHEAELVYARKHAEDLARVKATFVANMSHEIRTPLSSIIGFAGILAEQASEEDKEFAELIYMSGQRLMDTLNSVLDLAQLEGRAMRLSPEPLDLERQVEQSLKLFRKSAAERGLDLHCVNRSGHKVHVMEDRAALARVLNNLVGNANKFTKQGSVTAHIDSDVDYAYVTISDTGVGISASFLPHVFDEFSQESSGLQRSYEGSGLGLAITKRLVELMGGSISVTSSKGEGSSFRLRFKRKHGEGRSTGELAGENTPLRSVLVVEDNPEMRELFRHLLKGRYNVELSASRSDALERIVETQFDVVLLDVNLGEEATGITLLDELRSHSGHKKLAAVACTAYALPGDRQRFLKAGFDDYIGKPFTTENLFEVIDRLT